MADSDHYGFRNQYALEDHFRNHCDDERGFASIKEYGEAARAFSLATDADDLLECERKNRQTLRYHRVTQEFIILSPNRVYIVTYFYKALGKEKWRDNENWFRRKCRE